MRAPRLFFSFAHHGNGTAAKVDRDRQQMSIHFCATGFPQPIGFATYWKYTAMFRSVAKLTPKLKRRLFAGLRQPHVSADSLFPAQGLTAGDFAILQNLHSSRVKRS